jgi:chromate transport protein ChrA
VSSGVATKIDRYWVVRGVWLGLLLIAAGYFAVQATGFPIALGPHSIEITLLVLLVFPSALLLFGAAAATMRHRDHTQWIAMAIGAAVAALAIVLTVITGMGVIALIVA